MADWLEDPLIVYIEDSSSYKQLKGRQNDAQGKWQSFHFTTRLKLDGADHFCRLALGACSMPDALGLPLLAHRQTAWYLDAFFFELMSAYDTLLQEMNVVYKINLDVDKVRWSSVKNKLPKALKNLVESEWNAAWFEKLRSYRNMATHRLYTPTAALTVGWGEVPRDYGYHKVMIWYFDTNTNEWKDEDIIACRDYLKKMTEHIRAVWEKMAKEFD